MVNSMKKLFKWTDQWLGKSVGSLATIGGTAGRHAQQGESLLGNTASKTHKNW
jgi:hypothetical protein